MAPRCVADTSGVGSVRQPDAGEPHAGIEARAKHRVSSDGSEIWFGGAPVDRMRIMPMMGGPPRPFLVDRAAEVVWSSDGARMV